MATLTVAERFWIRRMRALAKDRPPTLGVWGGLGDAIVVVLNEDGGFMHGPEHDQRVVFVERIAGMPCGGGDPDSIDLEDLEQRP
jgi:hypothetical protein